MQKFLRGKPKIVKNYGRANYAIINVNYKVLFYNR